LDEAGFGQEEGGSRCGLDKSHRNIIFTLGRRITCFILLRYSFENTLHPIIGT
jgi:hypothetical protein